MMSNGKHTPGPWTVNDQLTFLIIHGPEGEHIAETGAWRHDVCQISNRKRAEMQANARLIAAAPELLEALEMVRDADDDCRSKILTCSFTSNGLPTIPTVARGKIDAAIARARIELGEE